METLIAPPESIHAHGISTFSHNLLSSNHHGMNIADQGPISSFTLPQLLPPLLSRHVSQCVSARAARLENVTGSETLGVSFPSRSPHCDATTPDPIRTPRFGG